LSANLEIAKVDAEGWPEFIDLPWRLHANDPGWVPPARAALMRELALGSAVPKGGALQGFVCRREGVVQGRVAALINPGLRDDGGPIGQLGYFDCIDDAAVAERLFASAMAWLAAAGARQAWGPMNGGAHRLHRLLVRGFETEPFLFEPRNPRYYPRLFEASGFQPVHRWQTFELGQQAVRPLAEMVSRLAARAQSVRVERLDPRDAGATLARLHRLLDGLWTGHVGYTSIDLAEFAEVFAGVLALMTREHVGMLVDRSGRDVGCAFMYPDWVSQVRALDGEVQGWGSWVTTEKARRLIMHTVALVPEARRSASPYALLHQGLDHFAQGGYEELVIALVTEDWRFFQRLGQPTREYALYGRGLF
jgi:hypothetical protein